VDCIRMIPHGTDLTNWKWRYPTIPIKAVKP
jgi:electron transport complex protein RnfB